MLILDNVSAKDNFTSELAESLSYQDKKAEWVPIPPDHELMRSFYLLDSLPSCNSEVWRGLQFDGRIAVFSIPYSFLKRL